MKILHIISNMDPKAGGVSQAVRTMIKGLTDLGTTNAVVCLDEQDSGLLTGNTFSAFSLGRGSTAWNINSKLRRWLKNNINQYDVAILHGLWQFQSYALLKSIPFADKTKIFVMPHGMLDPYFQSAPDRKLKAIRNVIFWNLIERNVIKKADGLLFTCETEKLLARNTFSQYHPKEETVVGLGVEPPPLYTESLVNGFLAKFPQRLTANGYLLYISRLHPKKGIDILIEAYLRLRRGGEFRMPPLVIAGPGLESDYGKQIQQQAIDEPDIIFTGMLAGDLKWGAFYGCEAFILPSHQENFGIAVVEALSCAKPVLISNQVNIWREIAHNNAGLVADDNMEGVTTLLKRWISLDTGPRTEMGRAAIETYQKHFTVDVAAKRIKDALSQAYAK